MNWLNHSEFKNLVERIIALNHQIKHLELRKVAGMYVDPHELRINKVLLGALRTRAEHFCIHCITINQLQA